MNADGTNTSELALPDKGYLIDLRGLQRQMVAFSWRRPDGNFDIYIMDPATREIRQITATVVRTSAPVGRRWTPHRLRIHAQRPAPNLTMLADGSQATCSPCPATTNRQTGPPSKMLAPFPQPLASHVQPCVSLRFFARCALIVTCAYFAQIFIVVRIVAN